MVLVPKRSPGIPRRIASRPLIGTDASLDLGGQDLWLRATGRGMQKSTSGQALRKEGEPPNFALPTVKHLDTLGRYLPTYLSYPWSPHPRLRVSRWPQPTWTNQSVLDTFDVRLDVCLDVCLNALSGRLLAGDMLCLEDLCRCSLVRQAFVWGPGPCRQPPNRSASSLARCLFWRSLLSA